MPVFQTRQQWGLVIQKYTQYKYRTRHKALKIEFQSKTMSKKKLFGYEEMYSASLARKYSCSAMLC